LPRLRVDAVDDFQQLRLGVHQVVVLLREELMALLGFLVFLNGHEIHRPHFVNLGLQAFHLLRDGVPVRAAPLAAICSGVSVSTLAGLRRRA
jgi:hypothetical protein